MKIYIVTSGRYSDYHIDAVFTDKEKAQIYIRTHTEYDYTDIEEYDADQPFDCFEYIAFAYDTKKNEIVKNDWYDHEDKDRLYSHRFIFYVKKTQRILDAISKNGINDNFILKIAQDRYAQYKYEHQAEE